MLRQIISSTLFRLLAAAVVGVVVGAYATEAVMNVVVSAKHLLAQLIIFFVPLIILSFIASSITKVGIIASRLVAIALLLAYCSSIGAAFMAMGVGYATIPHLPISEIIETQRVAPELSFELNIPPMMSVMTALVLAIMVGIAAVWSRATTTIKILDESQRMVLLLINRVLIPILPLFIASSFAIISYEGEVVAQLPIFFNIIVIALLAHIVWLIILYITAAIVTQQNPWQVVKYYAPPYLTAIGTMSSAATLPVALTAARRSPILREKSVNFAIPLLSNIHLCGSILTEVLFVMAISRILYGTLPDPSTMVLFILLLALFAVGAPGVPGGTVIASLGIVISVLGFDETATALLLTVFALQDSFGTACNVVGDGALTMIIDKYSRE